MIIVWIIVALVVLGAVRTLAGTSDSAAPAVPAPTSTAQPEIAAPTVTKECPTAAEIAYFDAVAPILDRITEEALVIAVLLAAVNDDPRLSSDPDWRLKLHQVKGNADAMLAEVLALSRPPSVEPVHESLEQSASNFQIAVTLFIEGTRPGSEFKLPLMNRHVALSNDAIRALTRKVDMFCN